MRALGEILAEVRGRIDAACARVGRDPAGVEIVAVTKTHGAEVVKEAWDAGLGIVGENKVQEAAWKRQASVSGPMWHLIGHLQSNKVRHALAIFDVIHSVDSARLADRINLVADEVGAAPRILLEVNVSGERSKSGMRPEEVGPTVRHIREACPRVTVVERSEGVGLPRLSMGMSGDYEVAVEEGATWVRLGTVLFGERPKARAARSADGGGAACGGLDSYSGEGPTFKVLD